MKLIEFKDLDKELKIMVIWGYASFIFTILLILIVGLSIAITQ